MLAMALITGGNMLSWATAYRAPAAAAKVIETPAAPPAVVDLRDPLEGARVRHAEAAAALDARLDALAQQRRLVRVARQAIGLPDDEPPEAA
jgi:hypothetical protein